MSIFAAGSSLPPEPNTSIVTSDEIQRNYRLRNSARNIAEGDAIWAEKQQKLYNVLQVNPQKPLIEIIAEESAASSGDEFLQLQVCFERLMTICKDSQTAQYITDALSPQERDAFINFTPDFVTGIAKTQGKMSKDRFIEYIQNSVAGAQNHDQQPYQQQQQQQVQQVQQQVQQQQQQQLVQYSPLQRKRRAAFSTPLSSQQNDTFTPRGSRTPYILSDTGDVVPLDPGSATDHSFLASCNHFGVIPPSNYYTTQDGKATYKQLENGMISMISGKYAQKREVEAADYFSGHGQNATTLGTTQGSISTVKLNPMQTTFSAPPAAATSSSIASSSPSDFGGSSDQSSIQFSPTQIQGNITVPFSFSPTPAKKVASSSSTPSGIYDPSDPFSASKFDYGISPDFNFRDDYELGEAAGLIAVPEHDRVLFFTSPYDGCKYKINFQEKQITYPPKCTEQGAHDAHRFAESVARYLEHREQFKDIQTDLDDGVFVGDPSLANSMGMSIAANVTPSNAGDGFASAAPSATQKQTGVITSILSKGSKGLSLFSSPKKGAKPKKPETGMGLPQKLTRGRKKKDEEDTLKYKRKLMRGGG